MQVGGPGRMAALPLDDGRPRLAALGRVAVAIVRDTARVALDELRIRPLHNAERNSESFAMGGAARYLSHLLHHRLRVLDKRGQRVAIAVGRRRDAGRKLDQRRHQVDCLGQGR